MKSVNSRLLATVLATVAVGTFGLRTMEFRGWAQESGEPARFELLPPTGSAPVGRISSHWVDDSRESNAADAGRKSDLMVHLWYPAEVAADEAAAPYIPGLEKLRAAIGEKNLREGAGDSYEGLFRARTHAVSGAAVSSGSAKHPVVLLTHGLRFNALGYSMLAEDLASHGYVVVGIDHPKTAFAVLYPDDRIQLFDEALWSRRRSVVEVHEFEQEIVERCASDLVFAINQLARLDSGMLPSPFQSRLDLDRVGVFGHSFGGRVAARACQRDKRLKAGIVCDGFGRKMTVEKRSDGSTMTQPMMVQYARRVPSSGLPRLLALLQTPGKDLEQELREVRKEFCESVRGPSYEVTLKTPGIVHESFSDMPWLESGQDESTHKNRRRAIELMRAYTRAFFDRHVRGLPASLLDKNPEHQDEVELARHRVGAP